MISKLRSRQKTSLLWALAATAAFASPTRAEEASAKDAFLEANILSIFYHELGHAVIDLMQVPIFGVDLPEHYVQIRPADIQALREDRFLLLFCQ